MYWYSTYYVAVHGVVCICAGSENCKNPFTAVHYMESDSYITCEDSVY